MITTGRDRTLDLNCPRCGAVVAFEIWRTDITVRAHDVASMSGQRHLMRGLSADVELLAEHTC